MSKSPLEQDFLLSICVGFLLGFGLAVVSPGSFSAGLFAAGLLCALSIFGMVRAWRWAGSGRSLAVMIVLAFVLRLGLGAFYRVTLPVYGYPEPSQQAGYFFIDDYQRDSQAWQLAQSGAPLWNAFTNEFVSDQYGGLLSLSALLYRTLSPDAHRPLLVVILGSFCSAVGIAFFFKGVQTRWNRRVALVGGWLLALFPDGVVFGSSQLREPFLIGLLAISFWAVLAWKSAPRASRWVLGASLAGITLFSFRVALPAAALMFGWLWLEYYSARLQGRWRFVSAAGFVLAVVLAVMTTWSWLQSSAQWDMLLTERNSGRVQVAVEEIGPRWRVPFIVTYGLTQPVFPAALADPAEPIHKVTAIFRSAGWYLIVPFLFAALFMVWKVRSPAEKRAILWLLGFTLFWILVSSARAGGDQWDNPRYRSIFLVWIALLVGWTWDWAAAHKDAWVARWFVVELIFLGFFTQWYLSRYYHLWDRLPFWQMVIWIAALGGLVVFGGFGWDAWQTRHRQLKSSSPQS